MCEGEGEGTQQTYCRSEISIRLRRIGMVVGARAKVGGSNGDVVGGGQPKLRQARGRAQEVFNSTPSHRP